MKIRNYTIIKHIGLFLLWPFFAMVYGIVNYRAGGFKYALWLFIIFFGFTFVISSTGIDASFYRDTLVEWHESSLSWGDFRILISEGEIGRGDFLQPLLTFGISAITGDYRILFAAFGLILGYFYASSLEVLVNRPKSKVNLQSLPFVLFFAVLVPFWFINGFRFWTATHIFVFGVLSYSVSRRVVYLVVALSSILVHFAFLIPCAILTSYLVLQRYHSAILALFVLSFIFKGFNIYSILSYLPELPAILNQRVGDYVHPEYLDIVQEIKGQTIWFVRLKGHVIVYLTIFIVVYLYIFHRRNIKKFGLDTMFYVAILLFSTSNILNSFPSMGRFFIVSGLLVMATTALICRYLPGDRWLKKLGFMAFFPLVFYTIVELRIGFDFIGPNTFVLNPLLAPFFENTHAFWDLIED